MSHESYGMVVRRGNNGSVDGDTLHSFADVEKGGSSPVDTPFRSLRTARFARVPTMEDADGSHFPTTERRAEEPKYKYAWRRFRGEGKRVPTTVESLKWLATHSILNLLFVFVPLSWVAYFVKNEDGSHYFRPATLFGQHFSKLAEHMVPYIGAELGDLLECTLNNAVEAALAIFLLIKDRYRLLQTTIVGVVLLRMVLISGVSFVSGGARVMEQDLHATTTQLNQVLLTLGVMAIVVPAAFFAALDRGTLSDMTTYAIRLNPDVPLVSEHAEAAAAASEVVGEHASDAVSHTTSAIAQIATTTAEHAAAAGEHAARALAYFVQRSGGGEEATHEDPQEFIKGHFEFAPLLSDQRRGHFLRMSHGISVMLLLCYVASRIYLHNPPGEGNALQMNANASEAIREKAKKKEMRDPKVGPWFGFISILITVALMTITAEWLVGSIEPVQLGSGLSQEWFGLVILPFVSWAADGLITLGYFARKIIQRRTPPPETAASALAIDLSVQFLLFWMPLLVLVAWLAGKPFTLLFDVLEIVMLVAAVFIVNYVTADAKTNWVEGCVLVAFYVIIAISAFYYPGQPEARIFNDKQTIAEALVMGPSVEG
ncbi:hypothetical protein BKA62DRAFT_709542 [Auriculariales sp. MPI-PUGE-AT-0066]|nr:hypothetical protein BKA62DRAFT_709542 [Auriculariales sp. MPI-PUGE-AT-0066]